MVESPPDEPIDNWFGFPATAESAPKDTGVPLRKICSFTPCAVELEPSVRRSVRFAGAAESVNVMWTFDPTEQLSPIEKAAVPPVVPAGCRAVARTDGRVTLTLGVLTVQLCLVIVGVVEIVAVDVAVVMQLPENLVVSVGKPDTTPPTTVPSTTSSARR